MTGVAPNQLFSASYVITANSTVNTAVSDLTAGTGGKMNFISISFAGAAAIAAGNGMVFRLEDAGLAQVYLVIAANRANSAALTLPGINLCSLVNMNIPFGNGLTVQVQSNEAGDSGAFDLTIGYDRTI